MSVGSSGERGTVNTLRGDCWQMLVCIQNSLTHGIHLYRYCCFITVSRLQTSISKPKCILSFYNRLGKAKLALMKNYIHFGIYISNSLEIKSVLMNLISSALNLNKYVKISCP